MASFDENTLKTKLESLDETQATIVSISEWILFHHRSIELSVKVWTEYIKTSSSTQKLPLIYVANEVIQKARAKGKDEVLQAFASVLPSVFLEIYPDLDAKVQLKFKRVVDIWRDRSIFDQTTVDSFYEQLKRASSERTSLRVSTERSHLKTPLSDMAPELIPLSSAYNRLSHSSSLLSSSFLKFESLYKELFNNDYNLPLPDIFISKLDKLTTLNLNSANSLNDIISIRESLIRDLNRVIKSQTESIEADKEKLSILAQKQEQVASKKKELQEYINGDDGVDAAQSENEEDEDDEMMPAYVASDDEDSNPPAKKQKTESPPLMQKQDSENDEEESPNYEQNDDSDSEQEVEEKPRAINPNLASLLSKLSE